MGAGLELRGISRFVDGERYLEGIDLRCEPGTFTVLLGHVRAGKTTLLRTMAGLDRPDAGRVYWHGQDVTHHSVRTRDVAMVYQQFVNYPSLSVYENIASPLRVQSRLTRAEVDRRVRDTAARLHIEELLARLPSELSGGQQQRTAIARALAKSAKLVLLDEPLANLDYKLREELRGELRGLFSGGETCVVYATSEPNEALWLGGTTAVMHEGRLLQVGPSQQVYSSPRSEQVGRVFSDPEMNVFEVEIADGAARATAHPTLAFDSLGPLASLPAGRHRVGVRAHDVGVTRRSPSDIRFPAVVQLEEITGSETFLRATSGSLQWTCQLHGVHRHALGTEVELFISPERLVIFDGGTSETASSHGPH
jgi:glycerol transport system ATP-binding protein